MAPFSVSTYCCIMCFQFVLYRIGYGIYFPDLSENPGIICKRVEAHTACTWDLGLQQLRSLYKKNTGSRTRVALGQPEVGGYGFHGQRWGWGWVRSWFVETKQHQYDETKKHELQNRTGGGPSVRLLLLLLLLSNYVLTAVLCLRCCWNQATPLLRSKGAGLPCVTNEIVVATLFMVPRWRLCRYVRLYAYVFPCCACWLPMGLCRVRHQDAVHALPFQNRTQNFESLRAYHAWSHYRHMWQRYITR